MKLRNLVVSAVVGSFVAGASVGISAQAATLSQIAYMGDYGGFRFFNVADTDSNWASTATYVADYKVAPSGWLGSEARLFKDNGALCGTGGMQYSTTALTEFKRIRAKGTTCGSGNYYSLGKAARWNGNGYSYSYTYKSPSAYMP